MKSKIIGFAMLLSVALLPLLLSGCDSASASVDRQTEYRALASALVATLESSATPAPAPIPSVPGKCANCDGTGKLGDGTVFVNCPVCGGDGRTDNEPPPILKPVSLIVPKSELPKASDCPGGVCALPQACGSGTCSAGGCSSCRTSRSSVRSYAYSRPRTGIFGFRRR